MQQKNSPLNVPDNWALKAKDTKQARFFLTTPLTSSEDLFSENINLLIQTLPEKDIDLDKFVKISESQYDTLMTNGKIELSERLQGNSGEFHKLIATADVNGVEMKFEQYFWVKKQKAYILTLTCEKAEFEKYQIDGEKIMDSFVIKK